MGQFPTTRYLASWALLAPENHKNAGKKAPEQPKGIRT